MSESGADYSKPRRHCQRDLRLILKKPLIFPHLARMREKHSTSSREHLYLLDKTRFSQRWETSMPLSSFSEKNKGSQRAFIKMVPKAGLEPARAYAHHPLKMACLPISPLRQILLATAYFAEPSCVSLSTEFLIH